VSQSRKANSDSPAPPDFQQPIAHRAPRNSKNPAGKKSEPSQLVYGDLTLTIEQHLSLVGFATRMFNTLKPGVRPGDSDAPTNKSVEMPSKGGRSGRGHKLQNYSTQIILDAFAELTEKF
jgi:hypothetical protein